MLIFYRIIYFIISNSLKILFPVFPATFQNWINLRSHSKIILGLKKESQTERVLFHAASGEIEYVKSLIRELKKKSPQTEIYVSYSSPSAEKLFANISEYVILFLPLPWDSPIQVRQFLDHLNPKLIIFSRTDFWPELIYQAHQRQIPLAAVSVYTQFNFIKCLWLKFVLSNFSLITAVSEKATNRLSRLLPISANVTLLADTRFDQVLHRLSEPSRFEIQTPKKIIVFGSTWPEDEIVLLQCVPELFNLGYQIIWCPHDVSVTRIQDLKNQLLEYSFDLFSENNSPYQFEKQILILDKIGYLADMYRYSQIAFIGGSFKAKVHSVMEPLCAGNAVVVGPYFKNNPEAVDFQKWGAVQSVQNAAELMTAIRSAPQQFIKSDLRKKIQEKSGATEKTVQFICDLLNKS